MACKDDLFKRCKVEITYVIGYPPPYSTPVLISVGELLYVFIWVESTEDRQVKRKIKQKNLK